MARSSCPRSCAPTWAWSGSRRKRDDQKGPLMSVTIVKPPPPKIKDTGVHPRRWTRKEYHRAAELGLFQPDERLELLDGEILQKMSPQNPPHAVGIGNT